MTRAIGLVLALAGCDAALDQRLAILDQPRVLAVIAEPAEAQPGQAVTYAVVVGGPDGAIEGGAATPRWAFCAAPKPPTEDNAVSTACLDAGNLVPLGAQATVTAALPSNGCLQFGPETPPGNFRPRDADPTGGYYQPVRVDVDLPGDPLLAFGLSRITCHLATAPSNVAFMYDMSYAANHNPTLDPIVVGPVRAHHDVTLTASWPAAAAEPYVFYDPASQTLVTRREAMRVSWFATGGAIDVDASAVDERDPTTSVSTIWHTPDAGTATLWQVLRDSRGGIAVQRAQVDVAP
ncbi:MAG TPA: hypothetical protein VFP84_40915 [Kofleriaceae bacterium]|nr:hypothetical protein [Kofleriaceae bacterium]